MEFQRLPSSCVSMVFLVLLEHLTMLPNRLRTVESVGRDVFPSSSLPLFPLWLLILLQHSPLKYSEPKSFGTLGSGHWVSG